MLISLITPFLLISTSSAIDVLGVSNIQYILNAGRRTVEGIIDKSGVKTDCANDLRALITDLFYRKLWALEMADAFGKIQPGLIWGNVYQAGNFDQCLAIREVRGDNVITGQYCGVVIMPSSNTSNILYSNIFDITSITQLFNIPKGIPLKNDILSGIKIIFGVCLPQSCSIQNLQTIWNYAEHSFALPIHAVFVDTFCTYDGKPIQKHEIDYYIYIFFVGMIGFVVLATLYDLVLNKNDEESILAAFSLYRNGKKIFSINTDESSLDCLGGLKVICMFWIILGHRFVANILSFNMNAFYTFKWRKHIENSLILSAPMAVDTYLSLSGILLVYTYLKYTVTGRQMKLSSFYAYRFFRLSIPLGAIILFYMSIFKHLSNGPAWASLAYKISGVCYKNWWATLFHVSNFLRFEDQCIEQAWYLGVDTQLYMLSPIFLCHIRKHPVKTLLAILSVGLLSILYTFAITIKYNYAATLFDGNKDYMEYIYTSTYTRMTAWLVGVIFGYFIYETKGKQLYLPKLLNIILWMLALAAMVGVIMWQFFFNNDEYDAWSAASFNAFSSPIWAMGVCWITFACVNGYGGAINTFLSLPIFKILAKLTYCMFLVHIGVILTLNGGQNYVGYLNNLRAYHDFWGDMMFTLVASTILCLIFESPILALGKILIKHHAKDQVQSKGTNTEDNTSTLWVFGFIGSKEEIKKLN